jgi:hypothetical protein
MIIIVEKFGLGDSKNHHKVYRGTVNFESYANTLFIFKYPRVFDRCMWHRNIRTFFSRKSVLIARFVYCSRGTIFIQSSNFIVLRHIFI